MAETGVAALNPRETVTRMKEYHPPLGGRAGLRLDFNENTVECSPKVLEAIHAISAADVTKYPEKESVERLAAEHLGLTAEQVLLTNGVDEAIHVLCQTYLDPGDELLLPVPTYSMYEVYGSGAGARTVAIPAGSDFAFPLERLLERVTERTRIIAIANPNSPTGSTVTREHILRIAEAAPHAAVLVDEAYFHFFGETVADLIGEVPNLLLARTFSKAYGLAGLRAGLLAGSPECVEVMRRVISPYSVNAVALACLTAAIKDEGYLHWYVNEVAAARAELATALTALQLKHWPSSANFVLVYIGENHKDFCLSMREKGVLVRDRSSDPGCDGCVRITVGTRGQTAHGVKVLQDVLAAQQPGAGNSNSGETL